MLCIYLHVYLRVYIYIYTLYIYTYIIYIYIYVYTYKCICLWIFVNKYVRRWFSKRCAETVSLIHCCRLHSDFWNQYHCFIMSDGFLWNQTTRHVSWSLLKWCQSRLFHLRVSIWPCFHVSASVWNKSGLGLVLETVVRYFRISWCVGHCYCDHSMKCDVCFGHRYFFARQVFFCCLTVQANGQSKESSRRTLPSEYQRGISSVSKQTKGPQDACVWLHADHCASHTVYIWRRTEVYILWSLDTTWHNPTSCFIRWHFQRIRCVGCLINILDAIPPYWQRFQPDLTILFEILLPIGCGPVEPKLNFAAKFSLTKQFQYHPPSLASFASFALKGWLTARHFPGVREFVPGQGILEVSYSGKETEWFQEQNWSFSIALACIASLSTPLSLHFLMSVFPSLMAQLMSIICSAHISCTLVWDGFGTILVWPVTMCAVQDRISEHVFDWVYPGMLCN